VRDLPSAARIVTPCDCEVCQLARVEAEIGGFYRGWDAAEATRDRRRPTLRQTIRNTIAGPLSALRKDRTK
jgi:hypothetical protein